MSIHHSLSYFIKQLKCKAEELEISTSKVREWIILLRLWTGCMDAAKAIRFSSVAGVRNGVVIEAPITTQNRYRYVSFQLIDFLFDLCCWGRSGAYL